MSEACPKPENQDRTNCPERNNNENIITINVPNQKGSPEASQSITIQPQPVRLSVDTSTDWPAVIATSSVAIAVGIMTYISQRNQIRASKAGFRHDWQKELRTLIAKFISLAATVRYEVGGNPDYLNSSESTELFGQLIDTHAKIELMLDRKKGYSKSISKITEDMILATRSSDINHLEALSNSLVDVANGVLEQAWQDIQDDLHGRKIKQ
ncbi:MULTISPECIES: hypothetical protein [Giesbergeria]|uniref:Uncharacterized protein n=1 Tax=Giesbergeria sinuosa TaxID=80883 RepID=A0ABV9QIC2_9BURK